MADIEQQLHSLQTRRDQLNARIQKLKAREAAKARKARTRRLIQVGAVVEKALGREFTDEGQRERLLAALTGLKAEVSSRIDGAPSAPPSYEPRPRHNETTL